MGLLGGGEDSLSGSSGWGVLPPINSSTEWGSSSSTSAVVNIQNTSTNSSSTATSSQSNQVSSANNSNSHWQMNNGRQTITASSTLANTVEQTSSTSTKPLSSWAQAAGKGLNNSNNSSSAVVAANISANNGPNSNSNSHDLYSTVSSKNANNSSSQNIGGSVTGNAFQCSNTINGATSVNTSCNANSGGGNNGKMRTPSADITVLSDELHESLLTEKWGSTVINHDSPWNLPPSPQSSPKDTSTWRCPVNSGTEIWETTVRQKKGSVSGVIGAFGGVIGAFGGDVTQNKSWDQTPSNYIGGTWGEEENANNHWTGVPQKINAVSGPTSSSSSTSINNWSASSGGIVSAPSSSNNANPAAVASCSNGTNSTNNASNSSIVNNKQMNIGNNINSIAAAVTVANPVNTVNMNVTANSNNLLNNNSWNGIDNGVSKTTINEPPRPKAISSNWENPESVSSMAANDSSNWEKFNENFGLWDKDSVDGSKSTMDGTAGWGNAARQTSKVSNWKDNKVNQNNANKNGWNNELQNNGNVNKMATQMMNRTWVDGSLNRKSPSLWNDDTKNLNGVGVPGANVPNNWSDGQVDGNNWNDKSMNDPITSTRKFRLLLDMGFKKENVETALRLHQMRLCEALDELYKIEGNQNSKTRIPDNIANTNRILHLVQSIQRVVHAGYLTPRVLNQPLSCGSLDLLYELVNQINLLENFQSQINGPAPDANQQMKLNQIKQTIANLQTQLQMISQQPSSAPTANSILGNGNNGNGGNKSMQHPMSQQKEFLKAKSDSGNIYGNNGGGGCMVDFTPQVSRLPSWKQSFKNDDKMNSDFVRAPGPISKQNSTPSANSWSFLNDEWPNDMSLLQTKPDKELIAQSQLMDEYPLSDLHVQDFEYKNNWKLNTNAATGAKGLDDDQRSPANLSLKDPMFSWNNKNLLSNNSNVEPLGGSFGFSSNTWSYNLNSQNNSQMFNVDMNNKKPFKSTWGNQLNSATDYISPDAIWNSVGGNSGAPGSNAISKPRPPPGLSQVKNSTASNNSNSNIWNSGLSSNSTSSEYLRLRNLTPQIDGSTLKTLCLQHGPLHLFHLFLNHGIALARYANRDQAIKAQLALNNCVLSNTTILADIPSESEIQQYLQLINGQQMSNSTTNQISSWSNGTSQHNVVVANSVIGQPTNNMYRNTVASAGAAAHMSSFGNTNLVNVTSPASTMPYGGGNNGGVTKTHSSSHTLPYNALNNANNAFNSNGGGAKLDTWSTAGAGLWDMQNSNAGNLWSTAGFTNADRNTPIQSFLPNDLLAGENNN